MDIYRKLPLDLQEHVHRVVFTKEVLPGIVHAHGEMCKQCLIHTPPCSWCAYMHYEGKYGPGNVNGVPTMIMQDSTYYDGHIYNEIYKWIDRTGRTPKVIY